MGAVDGGAGPEGRRTSKNDVRRGSCKEKNKRRDRRRGSIKDSDGLSKTSTASKDKRLSCGRVNPSARCEDSSSKQQQQQQLNSLAPLIARANSVSPAPLISPIPPMNGDNGSSGINAGKNTSSKGSKRTTDTLQVGPQLNKSHSGLSSELEYFMASESFQSRESAPAGRGIQRRPEPETNSKR